jgi:2-polyprenyl-6-methoxyphenol hydroxylase-like FAD-dependent oxidoreductase
MAANRSLDLVVVGGGIAGATLALVLARARMNVAVLERQVAYADRVRGEFIQPWGVAEAQRLGITDVLLRAGGFFVTHLVVYDDLLRRLRWTGPNMCSRPVWW